MQSTKKSLLASGLALLARSALLAGATLAWFTDSVTNTGNRIQAGSLLVDLLMDKDGTGAGGYESIADGSGDIFSETGNGINWEPGKTEIVYLAVENKGTLALSFDFSIRSESLPDTRNLGEVLACAMIEDANTSTQPITAGDWEELTAGLTSGVNRFDKLSTSRVPLDDYVLEAGQTKYFALAVHMKEEAENEYQNAAVAIDVAVSAKQATVETDGFGNSNYDAAVNYSIDSPEDLKEALTRPEDGAVYTVNADGLELGKITPSTDAAFTLDLNGHTVALTGATGMDLNKAVVAMTVTDSSEAQTGKLVHTGSGFMFINAFDDSVTGNGYLQADGKGLTNSGNVTNE